jgi:hypothetical protein
MSEENIQFTLEDLDFFTPSQLESFSEKQNKSLNKLDYNVEKSILENYRIQNYMSDEDFNYFLTLNKTNKSDFANFLVSSSLTSSSSSYNTCKKNIDVSFCTQKSLSTNDECFSSCFSKCLQEIKNLYHNLSQLKFIICEDSQIPIWKIKLSSFDLPFELLIVNEISTEQPLSSHEKYKNIVVSSEFQILSVNDLMLEFEKFNKLCSKIITWGYVPKEIIEIDEDKNLSRFFSYFSKSYTSLLSHADTGRLKIYNATQKYRTSDKEEHIKDLINFYDVCVTNLLFYFLCYRLLRTNNPVNVIISCLPENLFTAQKSISFIPSINEFINSKWFLAKTKVFDEGELIRTEMTCSSDFFVHRSNTNTIIR